MYHIRATGLQYGCRVIDEAGPLQLAFDNDGLSAHQAAKFSLYLRQQRADFDEAPAAVDAFPGRTVFTVRSAPPPRHTMRTAELAWERRGGATPGEARAAELLFGPAARPLLEVMTDLVGGPGLVDADGEELFTVLAAIEESQRPGVVEREIRKLLSIGSWRVLKETTIARLVDASGVESDDSTVDVLFQMVLSGAVVWFNRPGDIELRYRLQPQPPCPPVCACGRERAAYRRPNGWSPNDPALIGPTCWAARRSPQREEFYRPLGVR